MTTFDLVAAVGTLVFSAGNVWSAWDSYRTYRGAIHLYEEATAISERATMAFAENAMFKQFLHEEGYSVEIQRHTIGADGHGTILASIKKADVPGSWPAPPSSRMDH